MVKIIISKIKDKLYNRKNIWYFFYIKRIIFYSINCFWKLGKKWLIIWWKMGKRNVYRKGDINGFYIYEKYVILIIMRNVN